MFGFLVGTLSLIGLIKVARWGRYGHGRRGGPRRWMMRRLFQHLDTTPGQEKVIASVSENAERVMWQAREQFVRSRSAYAKAMRGEAFDSAAVNEAFEAQQASVEEVKKAVREEKYEDAAQIRDEIRELETKLKKSASVARSAG